MNRFNIAWDVVPHTGERILINRETGEVLEFTDDIEAPEQELPIVGLAGMFSDEDRQRLRRQYTDYELASGGA